MLIEYLLSSTLEFGLLKNTPVGREIMKDWKNAYNPNRWFYDGQKWKAKGMWAGKDYEQGAFVLKVLPKYRNSVKCLHWRVFQVFRREQAISSTFSVHFSGHRKKYLNTIRKEENAVS